MNVFVGAWAAAAVLGLGGASSDAVTPQDRAVPRYSHVFVIVEENKDYDQILAGQWTPNIANFARTYGNATQFFSEVHPSEANYVALLGGDTFGIHDDDAFYCKPGAVDAKCPGALQPGYVDHTVAAPHLGDQLQAAGMTWKGYYESLPSPGSLEVTATDRRIETPASASPVYASKHSGFLNFASVQTDPHRAEHIVDFDQLDHDLSSGQLPAFALVVPNQCNEMHGLPSAAGLPADCDGKQIGPLMARGDRITAELVAKIQKTAAWRSPDNVAIVVTFDEGTGKSTGGCCGYTPGAVSNYGGGHIPTVVITNHGPRGVQDDTPYSHYSLLRTLEDAFGLRAYLGRAADLAEGVKPMTRLFERAGPSEAAARTSR